MNSLPRSQIHVCFAAVDVPRESFARLRHHFQADSFDRKLKNGLRIHFVMCHFRSQAGKRFSATTSLGCRDKNNFTPNDRRRVASSRSLIFQLIFFVSLHSSGGLLCSATLVQAVSSIGPIASSDPTLSQAQPQGTTLR